MAMPAIRPQSGSILILAIAFIIGSVPTCTADAAVVNGGPEFDFNAPVRFRLEKGRFRCPDVVYIGFYNRTCSNPAQGPNMRTASKLWTAWELGATASGNDTYSIETFKQDDRNYKCVGAMAPTIKATCSSSSVAILPGDGSAWVFVPVKGSPGVFNIINVIDKRGAPSCRRFLTAPASCSVEQLSLTATNTGSSLQRWIVVQDEVAAPPPSSTTPSPEQPKPPPTPETSSPSPTSVSPSPLPAPDAPSSPRDVTAEWSSGRAAAIVTWSAPKNTGGAALLGYSVSCVSAGGSPVDVSPSVFPADTLTTGPGGLRGRWLADVPYTCSVVAFNSAGSSVPSAPSNMFLPRGDDPQPRYEPPPPPPPPPPAPIFAPGAPEDVTTAILTSTTWSPTWTDGSAGIPPETYSLKCVASGESCTATAVGTEVTGIAPGAGATYSSTPVTGLVAGVQYDCFVVASNTVGTSCSVPVPITTLVGPGAPEDVTTAILTSTTWSPTWTDGSAGIPPETYTLKCVASGESCTATAVGTEVTGLAPGAGATYSSTPVTGLVSGVQYDCFVVASNTVGTVCSAALGIQTLLAPGAPTGVTTVTLTSTTWSPTWTDGSSGIPQETYSLKCVASGESCTATAVGTGVTGIAPGAGAAYSGTPVNGLVSGVPYDCFVMASNSAGTVCSVPVPITPPLVPVRLYVTSEGMPVQMCYIDGLTLVGCQDAGGPAAVSSGVGIVDDTAYIIMLDSTYITCTVTQDGLFTACTTAASLGASETPIGMIVSGSTLFVPMLIGQKVLSCVIQQDKTLTCSNSGATPLSGPLFGSISGGYAYIPNLFGAYAAQVSVCPVSGSTLGTCNAFATGGGSISGTAVSTVGNTLFIADYYGLRACPITGNGASLGTCVTLTNTGYTFTGSRGMVLAGGVLWVNDSDADNVVSCQLSASGTEVENCALAASGIDGPFGMWVEYGLAPV